MFILNIDHGNPKHRWTPVMRDVWTKTQMFRGRCGLNEMLSVLSKGGEVLTSTADVVDS